MTAVLPFGVRTLSFVGAVLVSTAIAAASQAAPTAGKRALYAVPATAQFMNHADDRLRGMSTNPFNVNDKSLQLVIIANGKEKGSGPFPGDDILYTFKLYGDPKLSKPVGSAIFTCYYTFVKRATCDSYFKLDDGLVLASGQVVFNGKRFVLSVTGGTGKYLGALGAISASPAANNSERLDVRLLG